MKGGLDIKTPIPDRHIRSYERHKTYLSGYFRFDPATETGFVAQ